MSYNAFEFMCSLWKYSEVMFQPGPSDLLWMFKVYVAAKEIEEIH